MTTLALLTGTDAAFELRGAVSGDGPGERLDGLYHVDPKRHGAIGPIAIERGGGSLEGAFLLRREENESLFWPMRATSRSRRSPPRPRCPGSRSPKSRPPSAAGSMRGSRGSGTPPISASAASRARGACAPRASISPISPCASAARRRASASRTSGRRAPGARSAGAAGTPAAAWRCAGSTTVPSGNLRASPAISARAAPSAARSPY